MTDPAVFRQYSQAELEAQYDNRAKVSDFQAFAERFVERSAATRAARPRASLDVRVGPDPAQLVDIFPADRRAGRIAVFIHGGYWKAFSRKEFSFVANGLAPHGITTVVVGYGLLPTVTMADAVRHCRQAIGWVQDHAARLGGDAGQIALCGHSAGAQLMAVAVAGDALGPVRGGCSLSGVHDLEPVRLTSLQQTLALTPADVVDFSPVRLPAPSQGTWSVLVGSEEGEEYLRQSADLVQAWRSGGHRRTRLEVLDRVDHFSIVTQLDDPDSLVTRTLVSALR